MADTDIGNTLGRIEQKIDDVVNRLDRQNESLFGQGGIEPRLRKIETEMAVIETKAGFISALISGAVALAATAIGWIFKH